MESTSESYRGRLAQFRILEESRNALIEELINKLETAESQLRQKTLDLNSEQNVRRGFQEEARISRDKLAVAERELSQLKVKTEVELADVRAKAGMELAEVKVKTETELIAAKYKADGLEQELSKIKETSSTLEQSLVLVTNESTTLKTDIESAREESRVLEEKAGRRPYVVLLLDANAEGILFQDKYITKGYKGGEKAADELIAQVYDYLHDIDPSLPGVDVIIKAYADLESLADLLVSEGKIRNLGQLRSFTTAFSARAPFCDFIDVGMGEEAAASKIRESARLYSTSYQCKHTFIGCSFTSTMVTFLEQLYSEFPKNTSYITVLENSSTPLDYMNVPFKTTSFSSVFKMPMKYGRSRHQLQLKGNQDATYLVIRGDGSPVRHGGKNSDTSSVVISFGPGPDNAAPPNPRRERRRVMG